MSRFDQVAAFEGPTNGRIPPEPVIGMLLPTGRGGNQLRASITSAGWRRATGDQRPWTKR